MWEYKTITLPRSTFAADKFDPTRFNAELNELGAEGWELVSVDHMNEFLAATRIVVVVFKRPIERSKE